MSEYIVSFDGSENLAPALALAVASAGLKPLHEEIVRCRDCRFYDERHRECSMLECQECWYKLHDVEPDGFCAWGERRNA